ELRAWVGNLHQHLERMHRELQLFLPWLSILDAPPAGLLSAKNADVDAARRHVEDVFRVIPRTSEMQHYCSTANEALIQLDATIDAASMEPAAHEEARAWSRQLAEALVLARQSGQMLLDRLAEVRRHCEALIEQTDFSILYDERRRLMRIGYDVTSAQLDEH